MGLLKAVALLPVAPVIGVVKLAELLADEAERQQAVQYSPERALAELAAKRANGEISDEDADALEEQLLEQLLSQQGPAGGV
jgi:F0F1-type ATP synthase epsilon subunit